MLSSATLLVVYLVVLGAAENCRPSAVSAFVPPPVRLSRTAKHTGLASQMRATKPQVEKSGEQRMAEVDRKLGTFERDASFMAKYSEFQGLKEAKRYLTLQQTKGTSGAGVKVAGLTKKGWTNIFITVALLVSLVWVFFFTVDYMLAPLRADFGK
mmetsp:Transcript_18011/g.43339  ORF Transcript_18011/g.43339 Transcript_18011/m.43339 type:complete len:155 (-) Transcript_18011:303-767(-)